MESSEGLFSFSFWSKSRFGALLIAILFEFYSVVFDLVWNFQFSLRSMNSNFDIDILYDYWEFMISGSWSGIGKYRIFVVLETFYLFFD